jgi:hypothetical protein
MIGSLNQHMEFPMAVRGAMHFREHHTANQSMADAGYDAGAASA